MQLQTFVEDVHGSHVYTILDTTWQLACLQGRKCHSSGIQRKAWLALSSNKIVTRMLLPQSCSAAWSQHTTTLAYLH
eukprot:365702-Chlamydomonas_euryale.AAC.13